MESLISRKVDAIILAAVDSKGLARGWRPGPVYRIKGDHAGVASPSRPTFGGALLATLESEGRRMIGPAYLQEW
jgi:hypothetical protein